MPHARRNALILLHVSVFIWGWTGILGKLIQQPVGHLVFTRTLIGLAGLVAVGLVMRKPIGPGTPELWKYLGTGLIIAVHWITFYGAIKIGSASIAAACLSTSTVFTAILEPFWFKRRIRSYEVVLGLIVVAALLLIFGLESGHRTAIVVATLSALLSAWFNTINGVLVKRDDALRIGLYEMAGALAVVGIWLAATKDPPPALWELPARDLIGQLVLGLVCTTFAFLAGIVVMKQLTPFTVMLAVNLEPVYTILIALLLWPESERLHTGSYLGIALILLCLFGNGWLQRRTLKNADGPAVLTE
ncbi:MAG: DMT family transporter [Flavobacteriales bacterium]